MPNSNKYIVVDTAYTCVYVFVGFVALSDNNNYESAQRAFSQVVLQLRHLVNVWRNILPAHVYAKSLGIQANIVTVCLCCAV